MYRSHLKLIHDLSIDWRRCHACKKRFLREELDGHSPCERKDLGDDYEDGYDLDQAQDLKSDRTRPSKNPPESCWKAIFRVLFPDWPATTDTPNPCESTACRIRFEYLKAITNLQGTPDQPNAVSTYCADVIQQHRNRVMNRNTISQLYACESEDAIRQVLGLLIGDLESNFGHTPITTDNLPPRPVSAMSPQPTISPQHPQYQLLPVSQPNFVYSHERRSQFHTPAVSSSDANSSRFLRSHDQSDTFTEGTAVSDQRSTGFDSFGSHQGINISSTPSQFQPQMTLPVAQQPMSNISHHPGSTFAVGNQGMTPNNPWIDFSHDPQHQPQPVREDLVQGDLPPGDYDENEILSMAHF